MNVIHFQAEADQSDACKKFEDISEVARGELQDLKKRRLVAFKKNLTELSELQIKHTKVFFTFSGRRFNFDYSSYSHCSGSSTERKIYTLCIEFIVTNV